MVTLTFDVRGKTKSLEIAQWRFSISGPTMEAVERALYANLVDFARSKKCKELEFVDVRYPKEKRIFKRPMAGKKAQCTGQKELW